MVYTNTLNKPFVVHYEKIRNHFREKVNKCVKLHSLATEKP